MFLPWPFRLANVSETFRHITEQNSIGVWRCPMLADRWSMLGDRVSGFAASVASQVMQRWVVKDGVARSYEIISCRGTLGTAGQRLLVFTTAGRKAPAVLLDALLSHHPVVRRLRSRAGSVRRWR
jgi:hypothetical protein